MASNPYYWTTADALIHAMEFPEGGGIVWSPVKQYSISYDGTIIVGSVYDSVGNFFPAMWVNGVLTQLPVPDTITTFMDARLISADGTAIVGISADGYIVLWTDGGTVATILPQIPTSPTFGSDINCISNDGTVICGSNLDTSGPFSVRVAVYWDAGLPGGFGTVNALPNSRSGSSAFVADMQAHDASYIFGHTFSTDGNEDHLPLYWSPEGAETEHPLTTGSYNGGTVVTCSNGNSAAVFVPNNGVSGPFPATNDRYYWTAVDVSSGGYYGTLHQYGLLDGYSTIEVAFVGSQPKDTGQSAVGSAYNSNGVDNVGVFWTLSVAGQLGLSDEVSLPMRALCSGGQGYPIAGLAYTLDQNYLRAGIWDITHNNWTTLQVLNPNDDTVPYWISRDGSVVYGYASPVGVTTQLSMTDLEVDAFPKPLDNRVCLRWSDDAGASWSNGIFQTLGNVGQYLTDVQFRRLGMSRNRVFEVSWSGPEATALQGLFVGFETAAT